MHRILFHIAPFTLYSYGLFVAIGFLLSAILILKNSEKFDIRRNDVFDGLVAILIGGLIGARLLFVIINGEYYSRYPLKAFLIYEGGLAFHGGLGMGVLVAAVVTRIKKISFWNGSDLVAPYIALGQSVGRIGCFLNGCCYGKVVEKGIGVQFPREVVTRIPTQLYSSLFLLIIFVILIALRNRRLFNGHIFAMYLILYGVCRFFMDFARGDDLALAFGMKLSQTISIGMFLCGIVLYVVLRKRNRINVL